MMFFWFFFFTSPCIKRRGFTAASVKYNKLNSLVCPAFPRNRHGTPAVPKPCQTDARVYLSRSLEDKSRKEQIGVNEWYSGEGNDGLIKGPRASLCVRRTARTVKVALGDGVVGKQTRQARVLLWMQAKGAVRSHVGGVRFTLLDRSRLFWAARWRVLFAELWLGSFARRRSCSRRLHCVWERERSELRPHFCFDLLDRSELKIILVLFGVSLL